MDRIFGKNNHYTIGSKNYFHAGICHGYEPNRSLSGKANVIVNSGPFFQLRQFPNNLIGNVLKFTGPGIPAKIAVMTERINGSELIYLPINPKLVYCHIRVADNGIGFNIDFKDKIFQVFQRLHRKDQYSGTGIGLAIVKKIVDNQSGVISATSAIDNGTTLNIYIPEL